MAGMVSFVLSCWRGVSWGVLWQARLVKSRYCEICWVMAGERKVKVMKIFSWSTTTVKNADAQLVGEELEIIERNNSVSPKHIVDYARNNVDSELHKCFDWDDSSAAEKYRLYQANLIICSISLEIKEEPKKTQRVYVNIKDKDTDERVFKNINEVLKNDEEYQQLVSKASADLERCRDKYSNLLEKEDLKDIIFNIYKNI